MPIPLPVNVFEVRDEDFLGIVKEQCGSTMVEILRYLEVNSADTLLGIIDLFQFFHYNSPDLLPIKKKVGITLTDGTFVVKEGLLFQANSFIQKLKTFQQENLSTSNDLIISPAFLNQNPILRLFINFLKNSSLHSNDFSSRFQHTVIETIISNFVRPKNHYCYNDSIRDFGSCLFILGGRHVYEYIRLNISGFLPSLPIIQASIDSTTNRIVEGEFRYDLLFDFLSCQKTNFIVLSEDCTGVVPRIEYNVHSNTFIGFSPRLEDGLPQINSFSTESFSKLENWFETLKKSRLLNLHMVQPINLISSSCSIFILSAYGTDNEFTTWDILMRWMSIINQCDKKGIKVLGFSTDCDARYLRSMRLLMGFFADMPNQQFHLRDNAFCVDIPKVI